MQHFCPVGGEGGGIKLIYKHDLQYTCKIYK